MEPRGNVAGTLERLITIPVAQSRPANPLTPAVSSCQADSGSFCRTAQVPSRRFRLPWRRIPIFFLIQCAASFRAASR